MCVLVRSDPRCQFSLDDELERNFKINSVITALRSCLKISEGKKTCKRNSIVIATHFFLIWFFCCRGFSPAENEMYFFLSTSTPAICVKHKEIVSFVLIFFVHAIVGYLAEHCVDLILLGRLFNSMALI